MSISGLTVSRENLTSRVYGQLRESLMAGRFWPGQRLRIRDMALAMGVSPTPVREAIMQLVREGGLETRSSQAITVTRLSVARYTQLREVRLLLEGLATEKATALLTAQDIKRLEALHADLVKAEKADDRVAATLTNFQFHFTIYRGSQASDLVEILESIWLRNGPLLKFLYPHAAPTYRGRHQHLHLLDALRRRDADAAKRAIQDDIQEGGQKLVELMERIEAGTVRLVEDEDGETSLVFPTRKRKAAA